MVIKFDQLKEIRNKHKNEKIVIVAGCFDLFHVGHLNYLRNGKNEGDILVVVVRDDASLKLYKGDNRPVIDEEQRIEIVDNIKFVDYTIKMEKIYDYKSMIEKYNIGNVYQEQSLWERYIPIIEELKPDVVFTLESNLSYPSMLKRFEELNVDLVFSVPLEGVSTTDILSKTENNKIGSCLN